VTARKAPRHHRQAIERFRRSLSRHLPKSRGSAALAVSYAHHTKQLTHD
jgi:hypothetical protein